MKKIAIVIILFVCEALLFSCSGHKDELDIFNIQYINKLFRQSTSVVRAECVNVSKDKIVYKFHVNEIIAGKTDEYVILTDGTFEIKEEYLVFLINKNEKGRYNSQNYTAIPIKDNILLLDNKHFEVNDVVAKIKDLSEIISVHAHSYYYTQIDNFLENSEIVVVGRISDNQKKEQRKVRSTTQGVVMENTQTCDEVNISVIGCLKGNYKTGDKITMIRMPEQLSSMIDADTLSTVALTEKDVIVLESKKYYLFFLIKSPDSKQDFCFPINPAQGWAGLAGNRITVSEKNELFTNCNTLDALLNEIK